MEDKEIEHLLKESAEKIKMKDFSERWSVISEKIQSSQVLGDNVTADQTVLVSQTNNVLSRASITKKIVYSVCSVFLFVAICLAVVLPICLIKNEEQPRYALNGLNSFNVSESSYYDEIHKSGLAVIDFSGFETNIYTLFYTKDDVLVGGGAEITDEEFGGYIELVFYTDKVTSQFDIGLDFKKCVINGYKIEYKTETTEDFYSTKAKAVKGNIVYELDCLAVEENIEVLFEKLFSL